MVLIIAVTGITLLVVVNFNTYLYAFRICHATKLLGLHTGRTEFSNVSCKEIVRGIWVSDASRLPISQRSFSLQILTLLFDLKVLPINVVVLTQHDNVTIHLSKFICRPIT